MDYDLKKNPKQNRKLHKKDLKCFLGVSLNLNKISVFYKSVVLHKKWQSRDAFLHQQPWPRVTFWRPSITQNLKNWWYVTHQYLRTSFQVHAHTLKHSISVKMAEDLKALSQKQKYVKAVSQIPWKSHLLKNEPCHPFRQHLKWKSNISTSQQR